MNINSRVIASSTVIEVCTALSAFVWTVGSRSRIGRWLRIIFCGLRTSWDDSQSSNGLQRLHTISSESVLVQVASGWSATAYDAGRGAARGHWLTSLWSWGQLKVEQSWLYGWLTAEPEPEVIVIDLRETWTAGPVLASIDRALAELLPGVQSARVTTVLRRGWDHVIEQPLRYVGIMVAIVVSLSAVRLIVASTWSPWMLGLHIVLLAMGLLALRSTRSMDDLLETRVAQYLIAAFEPPEPIESDDNR